MSYRVFWSPNAEDRLERLLQDTSNQSHCAAAAPGQLISDLRANPWNLVSLDMMLFESPSNIHSAFNTSYTKTSTR